MNQAERARAKFARSEKAPVAADELRERLGRRLLRGGGELTLGSLDLGDDGVRE